MNGLTLWSLSARLVVVSVWASEGGGAGIASTIGIATHRIGGILTRRLRIWGRGRKRIARVGLTVTRTGSHDGVEEIRRETAVWS